MSEAPYMKLFVADYLGDTMHLTAEQHGAYLLILMAMWRAGGWLPNDPSKLARIARIDARKWHFIADDLMEFFTVEGDKITQLRLLTERNNVHSIAEKRAIAGRAGGLANALKNNKPARANATDLPQQKPSKPAHISESESYIKPPYNPPKGDDLPVLEAFEFYNEVAKAKGLSKAVNLTPERRAKLRTMLKRHGLEVFKEAVEAAGASTFCCGDNDREWKASLDFVLRPQKFTALLEGAYFKSKSTPKGARKNGQGWIIPLDSREANAWERHFKRCNDERELARFRYARKAGEVEIRVGSQWPMRE